MQTTGKASSQVTIGNPNGVHWTRNDLIAALSRIADELDGEFDPSDDSGVATAHSIALGFSETPLDADAGNAWVGRGDVQSLTGAVFAAFILGVCVGWWAA